MVLNHSSECNPDRRLGSDVLKRIPGEVENLDSDEIVCS